MTTFFLQQNAKVGKWKIKLIDGKKIVPLFNLCPLMPFSLIHIDATNTLLAYTYNTQRYPHSIM
jgi:hypothetical protein